MARRLALLIATYQYHDRGLRQLTAPAHDAEAFAAVLRDPRIGGFEVTTLINEPHYRVGEAVGEFYGNRRRDDLTLLYFTGHGLKDDDGRLYLATTNTRRDTLLFSSLPAEQINIAMEDCASRQKVLILDCCYSGAFPLGRVAKASTEVHTLERFQGRGRVVLTASDATQYAFQGDEASGNAAQSVFTRYLVAGLRDGSADLNGDGDITIDELYSYAHERVVDEMPQQRPKKQDNVEGSIVVAKNVNWSPPASRHPRPDRQSIPSTTPVPTPNVAAAPTPPPPPAVRRPDPVHLAPTPPAQRPGLVSQPRPQEPWRLANLKGRRSVVLAALTAVILLATTFVLLQIRDHSNTPDGGSPPGNSSGVPPNNPGKIIVGSANFPENALLAEIYAAAIAAKGITVEKKLNIGNRETYYPGLSDGSIDVVPEYTGVLLQYLNGSATEASADDVYAALKRALPPNLTVLRKASAEDKDAVVVTRATADKWSLKSISDLKAHAGEVIFGGPPEFRGRPDGLVGLETNYGIVFKDFKSVDVGGPLTVNALKTGAVQAADIFTTDPSIKVNNFVVLDDPKNNFAAQNVVPLINSGKASDEVKQALNAVSAKLTTEILIELLTKLNAPDKPDASKVAADWLSSNGLK